MNFDVFFFSTIRDNIEKRKWKKVRGQGRINKPKSKEQITQLQKLASEKE